MRSSVIGSELPIAIPYPDDSEESDDDDKAERVNHDNVFKDIDETEVLSAQGKYITITLNNLYSVSCSKKIPQFYALKAD